MRAVEIQTLLTRIKNHAKAECESHRRHPRKETWLHQASHHALVSHERLREDEDRRRACRFWLELEAHTDNLDRVRQRSGDGGRCAGAAESSQRDMR